VLIEAMLLALLGGLIGGGLVYLLYDGYAASTLSSSSLSQVAFRFAVTPGLIGAGLAGALILGLLGGIVPALGAARTGVVEGLRET
jgi:putative ABC transport system permease protein